ERYRGVPSHRRRAGALRARGAPWPQDMIRAMKREPGRMRLTMKRLMLTTILIATMPAAGAIVVIRAQNRAGAPVKPADLVLQGGKIVTVDDAKPEAQAIAVSGDTIVAVGSAADVK